MYSSVRPFVCLSASVRLLEALKKPHLVCSHLKPGVWRRINYDMPMCPHITIKIYLYESGCLNANVCFRYPIPDMYIHTHIHTYKWEMFAFKSMKAFVVSYTQRNISFERKAKTYRAACERVNFVINKQDFVALQKFSFKKWNIFLTPDIFLHVCMYYIPMYELMCVMWVGWY